VGIVQVSVELWPNEVCDSILVRKWNYKSYPMSQFHGKFAGSVTLSPLISSESLGIVIQPLLWGGDLCNDLPCKAAAADGRDCMKL